MTYAYGKKESMYLLVSRPQWGGQDKETHVPPWNRTQVAQHVTSDFNDRNTAYVTGF